MLESSSEDLNNDIQLKSDELWSKYQYEKNEKDRVVLSVSLSAFDNKNKKLNIKLVRTDEME